MIVNVEQREWLQLVRFWQREHGLKVDGLIGPETMKSLKSETVFQKMPIPSPFMNRAMSYALNDTGQGEGIVNNGGPYVRGLRQFCGFPVDRLGAWCAIFLSAKFKAAAGSFGMALPFELSRGAYRLVMNIGEAEGGQFLKVPQIGCVAAYKRRGWLLFRKAHVRLFTDYDAKSDTVFYVAGNEDGLVRVGQLKNGAWRKDLIVMATI